MNIEFSRRLLAGFANSSLTGNVYMAECAPSHLVPSLKQIEMMSFDVFSFKVFFFFAVTLSLTSRHRRPSGAWVPFSSLPSTLFSFRFSLRCHCWRPPTCSCLSWHPLSSKEPVFCIEVDFAWSLWRRSFEVDVAGKRKSRKSVAQMPTIPIPKINARSPRWERITIRIPHSGTGVVQAAGLDPHHHLSPKLLRLHLHQSSCSKF